jgi:hypothetical protein
MSTKKGLVVGARVAGIVVAAALATFFAVGAAVGAEVTVYKSPACGCCKGWVAHMERNGFSMKANDINDVSPVKTRNGVPTRLWSCHTALVDGYVIEGHVPAGDIQRLLRERPDVRGLAVPGMVVGSPGMEGARRDRYQVLSFDNDGKTAVYASH